MSCATVISPIELSFVDDLGRRGDWSEEEKVRIFEKSLQGFRQSSLTARCYGLLRSLFTCWRREYLCGHLNVSTNAFRAAFDFATVGGIFRDGPAAT
jgi:transposase